MSTLSIIGIILTVSVISIVLKRYNKEYAIILDVIVGVLTLTFVFDKFMPLISEIKHLIYLAKIPSEYGNILFKSLGICFVTQFASDSCRDSGETSLASKIEFVGKISVIITALPLFKIVTQTAISLIGR